MLTIGGPESAKTNALLNLTNNQRGSGKIYLYTNDPYEAKYQFSINKRESVALKHYIDQTRKEQKALIVFDDIVADVISNK